MQGAAECCLVQRALRPFVLCLEFKTANEQRDSSPLTETEPAEPKGAVCTDEGRTSVLTAAAASLWFKSCPFSSPTCLCQGCTPFAHQTPGPHVTSLWLLSSAVSLLSPACHSLSDTPRTQPHLVMGQCLPSLLPPQLLTVVLCGSLGTSV